ncbi:MAG: HD domain-containing protein [Sulfurimonas sp.]|nr:HD domain-containing protein [Sulfurimonas sp.]
MKVIKTKLNYAKFYATFDISSVKVEDTIPFDIFIKRDKDYIIIIEAGTFISEKLYAKLKKQENLYIDKKDEEKQILSCETLKYYIRYNRDDIKKRVQLLYEVNDQLFDIYFSNKDNKINLDCVELIIKSVIYLIKYDKKFIKNSIPHFKYDHKIQNHSLQVTLYAISLGNALNLNEARLLQLGIAALLHDIGYKKVDDSILNKNTPLSSEENKQIQKHTQYGVDILKQNHINDSYVIDAVMHHHERYDGSGYPEKLTKDDISEFASIISICDVFDALTNNRPHRKEYSSFDALKMMMQDPSMANQFNSEYLKISVKLL